MNEMIRKAALAVAMVKDPGAKVFWPEDARTAVAVIEAMREPTEPMRAAGGDANADGHGYPEPFGSEVIYGAMIDAALKPD